jgi:hypothetical protein
MRNLILGFLAGLVVSGAVWAAGPTLMPFGQSAPSSRPDRLWQQDRGASVQEYLQQREQASVHEQQEHDLKQEVERLKHQPC